jgi:hypothetical protein
MNKSKIIYHSLKVNLTVMIMDTRISDFSISNLK